MKRALLLLALLAVTARVVSADDDECGDEKILPSYFESCFTYTCTAVGKARVTISNMGKCSYLSIHFRSYGTSSPYGSCMARVTSPSQYVDIDCDKSYYVVINRDGYRGKKLSNYCATPSSDGLCTESGAYAAKKQYCRYIWKPVCYPGNNTVCKPSEGPCDEDDFYVKGCYCPNRCKSKGTPCPLFFALPRGPNCFNSTQCDGNCTCEAIPQPYGFPCRTPPQPCDRPDVCDGKNLTCPTHAPVCLSSNDGGIPTGFTCNPNNGGPIPTKRRN